MKVHVHKVRPVKEGLVVQVGIESKTWLKFEVLVIPWPMLTTREVMRATLGATEPETPPPPWDEDVPLFG